MTALPEAVRARVAALATAALGGLRPEEVPASLRAVARFAPAKRAKAGAGALLTALEADPLFRSRVVGQARAAHPELAEALTSGASTDGAREDAAAVAFLLRSEGWQERVGEVARAEAATREERDAESLRARLSQLETERSTAELDVARANEEARYAKDELTVVRRKARDLGSRVGRAQELQEAAEKERDALRGELEREQQRHAAQVRALEDRLADAERAVGEVRHAQREGAKGDQLRLRLLLDTVVNAASGLRRELALPPAQGRPADALEADYAASGRAASVQGRSAEDPGLLDALLAVPTTHLLVDGYNVTKTGYPSLSLEAQRTRLLTGLGALAARTQAEVTVVFDGATGAVPVKLPAPRGVRLLFSRTGETADEVLRRLARHEPAGRPVVVVSTDREVADGVREAGATAVPSLALLGLLERGRTVGPPP